MISPIPKRFLNSAAVLIEGAVETPLENIRIEESHTVSKSDGVVTDSHIYTLFYDCVNSKPSGVDFTPGGADKFIRWGGKNLSIQKAETLVYSGVSHHIEVTLGEEYKINAACY
jgi:hypothetical protein